MIGQLLTNTNEKNCQLNKAWKAHNSTSIHAVFGRARKAGHFPCKVETGEAVGARPTNPILRPGRSRRPQCRSPPLLSPAAFSDRLMKKEKKKSDGGVVRSANPTWPALPWRPLRNDGACFVCVTESRAEIRGWTASGRRVSAGGAGHPPPLLSLARVAFAFAVRSASLESNPLCLAWRGAASGAEEAAEARSTASSLTSPHARPGAGGENFPVFDTAPTRPEISRSYPGDRRGTDQLGRRQGRAGPVHRHTHWQFFFLSPVVA